MFGIRGSNFEYWESLFLRQFHVVTFAGKNNIVPHLSQ